MKTFKIKRGQEAGFTLVELIVVIVILGILAAMALPKFTGVQSIADTEAAAYAAKATATGTAVTAAALTGVTVGTL